MRDLEAVVGRAELGGRSGSEVVTTAALPIRPCLDEVVDAQDSRSSQHNSVPT